MMREEAMQKALGGATAGPVPAAPLYLSLYLEPRRRRSLAEVYREMAGAGSELVLTFEDELAARVEAWRRAWQAITDPPAWMPCQLGPSRTAVAGARVTFEEGRCLWYPPGADRHSDDLLAFYDNRSEDIWELSNPPVTSAQVESALPVPSAERYLSDGQGRYPQLLHERFGDQYCLVAATGTPYWLSYDTFGFRAFMENMRQRPELLLAACRRNLQILLAQAQACWLAGTRVMFIEECLSGPDLISAADYRRFCWPFLRDFLTGLKDLGFTTVCYHCGGIQGRLELLAQSAADALAFEESKKGFVIDLAQIRREIGEEKVLFGNTDAVLIRDGAQQDIMADVQRQYAAAGPRFVASIGSPFTLDTSEEKVSMLVRAAATLRE